LKVVGQDGNVVRFKVKPYVTMKKLMKSYCERKGVLMHVLRFHFEDRRINELNTPVELGIEDGGFIEVYQEQDGGFCV
jgi:hypothetical protein